MSDIEWNPEFNKIRTELFWARFWLVMVAFATVTITFIACERTTDTRNLHREKTAWQARERTMQTDLTRLREQNTRLEREAATCAHEHVELASEHISLLVCERMLTRCCPGGTP